MSWRQVDCKILLSITFHVLEGGDIANHRGEKAILIICITRRFGLLCRKEDWILRRRRRG